MTLKKSKKGQVKGQAIFEYFIVTTLVLVMVLFFLNSQPFRDIKGSCETAFDKATLAILGAASHIY